jgi:hypothetical protein
LPEELSKLMPELYNEKEQSQNPFSVLERTISEYIMTNKVVSRPPTARRKSYAVAKCEPSNALD